MTISAFDALQRVGKVLVQSARAGAVFAVALAVAFTSVPSAAYAAFPTVSSITQTAFSVDDNNHLVAMPATVDAGDLLIVLFTNDGSATVTTPSGWTQLFSTNQSPDNRLRASAYAKDAIGNEDGTTVDFVTSSNEQGAAQVYRIPAAQWYGDLANGVAIGSASQDDQGNSPNPPSLNPSAWGTEDTLWIAYAGLSANGTPAVSGYPSNYTSTTLTTSNSSTDSAQVASARRQLNASSEDPGSFTSVTSANVSNTIAIRPAALTTQTITVTTAAPASATYGSTFPVAATASSGLTVAITVSGGCSILGGTVTMTSGTTACSVKYNQAGDASFAAAPEVTNTTTATKKAVTAAADNKSKLFGQANPALTYQITSGSLVGADAFTGAITRTAGEAVGTYPITQGTLALNANNYTLTFVPGTFTINPVDSTPPTVTINEADGQDDPTTASPINFTVVFSESVADFATGDVTLSGTAEGTLVGAVTGSGTTYNVAVSGMTSFGTVVASIASGAANDAAGNDNAASTSTDNSVFFDVTAPTCAVELPGNLLDNPCLELVQVDEPAFWSKSANSDTATFTYPFAGEGGAGSKAAKVEVTDHVSGGDAKWFFDPVAVEGDADYVYTAKYKSNIVTRVAIMECDGATCSFPEALNGVVATTSAWGEVAFEFHTESGTDTVSVFHLIENVGWLAVDTASLSAIEPIEVTDMVPNSSVEEESPVNPELPRGWTTAGYETVGSDITPIFEYLDNDGHGAGDRSVKVTVTGFDPGEDADAKWMYIPQPVAVNDDEEYRFTAWYKTDTTPHVVAQFTVNGNTKFLGLPNPLTTDPTEGDWKKYETEFSAPEGATDVTVFFFLKSNGFVQTDDYSIDNSYSYDEFNRAMVTLTFDDGFEGNVDSVLPVLEGQGAYAGINLPSTQCFKTDTENLAAGVLAFFNAGHEVCAHTNSHPDLTTLSNVAMESELQVSKDMLEDIIDAPVTSFATPFGAYNAVVNTEIMERFSIHRTVDEGYNSKDALDISRLRVQNMKPTTTLEEFQGWVEKAAEDKTWLVLVYHKIIPSGTPVCTPSSTTVCTDPFDTYKADFDAQMAWLDAEVDAGNVVVKTLKAAYAETQDAEAPTADVSYDVTTPTTGSVVASLVNPSETITVTNNGGLLTKTFTENGSFIFEFEDAAGNAGSATATVSNIDTVAPGVTLSTEATNPTGTSPILVTATFTEKVEGFTEGDITVGNGSADNLQSADDIIYTFEVTPTTDGLVTVDIAAAVATDLAGTANTAALQLETTYDASGPALSFTSAPVDGVIVGTSPVEIAFEAGVDATMLECALDAGAFTPCASPQSLTPTDGLHVFSVRATDALTNATTIVTSFILDTTDPVVTVSPVASPSDASPSVTFTVSDTTEVTIECAVDAGAYAPCASPLELSGLTDGAHEVTVRATDETGRTGSGTTGSFTVDATGPVITVSDAPAAFISTVTGESITFEIEGETSATCLLDGGSVPCESFELPADLFEGAHLFSITAIDDVGNDDAEEVTFTLDLTDPTVTIDSAPAPLTGPNPTLTFTAADTNLETVECKINDGEYAPCASPVVFDLPDGEYDVLVRATDKAGRSTVSSTVSFTIDSNVPTVTIEPLADSVINEFQIDVTFEAESDTTLSCELNDDAVTPCESPMTLVLAMDDLDDLYKEFTFEVTATDGLYEGSDSVSFAVDLAAPVITFGGVNTDVPSAPTASFSVSDDTAVTTECAVDGGEFAPCASPFVLSGLTDGAHTLSVRATDEAGNATTETSEEILVNLPPVITVLGDAIVFVLQNGTYEDAGATAHDGSTVTDDSDTAVDLATEGLYTVTYTADDEENEPVTATRTVVVSSVELSGEQTTNTAETSVTISWTTSHPASSRVLYDTVSHTPLTSDDAPNYGYQFSTVTTDEDPKVTLHTVVVSGLSSGTTYHFRPVSIGSPETLGDEIMVTTASPALTASSNEGNGGGGGGATYTVKIAGGAAETDSRDVTLTLKRGSNKATQMWVSNTASFSEGAWEDFDDSVSWTLSAGDGVKRVYVRFGDKNDAVLKTASDAIRFETAGGEPVEEGETSGNGEVLGAATYVFTRHLTVGMTGGDVTELQKILIAEGFLSVPAPTGYFGALTAEAVKKYQAAHGIAPQSGYVGPLTIAALNSSTVPVATTDAALKAQIAELLALIAKLQASLPAQGG